MPNVDQESQSIAEVYASALIELAVEKNQADEIETELSDLAAFLDGSGDGGGDFERFLSSPTVPEEARQTVFEKTFRGRMSDLLLNALLVMNRKGRANLIRAVAEAYRLLMEERKGEVDVVVRTAVKLGDESRERVRKAAEAYAGKKPHLIEEVDESLIGGLVLQIGDTKLDTSVAAQLARMQHAFLERASHEIRGEQRYVEESAT